MVMGHTPIEWPGYLIRMIIVPASQHPVTIILIVNSLSVVSLVLTQNDTTKEELSKKSSSSNPFEVALWVTVILELILLLVQIKVSDF